MPTYQVSPVVLDLLKHFEGEPRLTARRCEGDRWELGYGCTYDFNNVPFGPNSTLRPQDAEPLAMHCMSREAQPLWDLFDRHDIVPTQSEIDAFAFWAYNVGSSAALNSDDVTGNYLAGRVEDAAAGFAGWTGATSAGPSKTERNSGLYNDMIAWSKRRRRWVWVGQDGRACNYFKRMRGLLRRQLATGCTMLGYDFMEACRDDAVSMRTKRRWDARKRMWRDGIVTMTSFKEVERVARNFPRTEYAKPTYERGSLRDLLEDDDDDLRIPDMPSRTHRDNRRYAANHEDNRRAPAPYREPDPVLFEEEFETEPYNPYAEDIADEVVSETVKTPPIAPAADKKPVIEEDLGYEMEDSRPKSLDNSDRVDGLVLQRVGQTVVRVGSRGVFGSGAVGVFQFIQDDPALVTALSVLFASTVIILVGWFTGVVGNWKRKRGEETATQPLG